MYTFIFCRAAIVSVVAASALLWTKPTAAPVSFVDDPVTPDCFCELSWEANDGFTPAVGQTEPGDWTSDWTSNGIKVVNVELSLTEDNGGCEDAPNNGDCTVPVRPCRKIVTGDVVTNVQHGVKFYWHEVNGITEKSIETVPAGDDTTPFQQTLSRPCDDGVPVAFTGFQVFEDPADATGWESSWGWEMKCGDCGTAQTGSGE